MRHDMICKVTKQFANSSPKIPQSGSSIHTPSAPSDFDDNISDALGISASGSQMEIDSDAPGTGTINDETSSKVAQVRVEFLDIMGNKIEQTRYTNDLEIVQIMYSFDPAIEAELPFSGVGGLVSNMSSSEEIFSIWKEEKKITEILYMVIGEIRSLLLSSAQLSEYLYC